MATPGQPDQQTPPPSTVLLLLGDIADTTWRMFLSPIIGGLLGWWADTTWHTAPWFSIIGVLLGCVMTGFLVRQLLNKIGKS